MVESAEKPLVTITGVSGYLGSQTAYVFLKDGNYRVRGTVRSTTNPAKIDPLKAGFGELFDKLELVEADLLDEPSIIKACEGSTYVIHTASPFLPQLPEEELVKPAVQGTLAVMKACAQHKVKRVVITSSVAAVSATAKEDKPTAGGKWNESHWSNPDREGGLPGYTKSKTLAEKAAWDYQASQPEAERFEIATINPVFIMGPSICAGDGTSEGWMSRMLNGAVEKIPRSYIGLVDVRDVAIAHLKAVQVAEAANKRFILCVKDAWAREVAGILAPIYNPKGYKVPTVDADGEDPDAGADCDNTRSREVLGVEYTPFATTMTDMADSLIASGKVKPST